MPGTEPVTPGLPAVPTRPLPVRRHAPRTGSGPVARGGAGSPDRRPVVETLVEEAMTIAAQMESDGALAGAPEVTVG